MFDSNSYTEHIDLLQNELNVLKKENAQLKKRLENAVELPLLIGSSIVWKNTQLDEYVISDYNYRENAEKVFSGEVYKRGQNEKSKT